MFHVNRSNRIALLLLIVALVLPTAASAQRGDPDPGDKPIGDDESIQADAEVLARQRDWRVDDTIRYMEESRVFAAVAADLAANFADHYASAAYADAPDGTSIVRFRGQPSADALKVIDSSDLKIEVQTDARYTETAIQDRAQKVHDNLVGQGFKEVVTATTASDVILATVVGDGRPTLPKGLRTGVEISQEQESAVSDEHSRGGARLRNSGTNWCTSGFSVRANDGRTGIATAGHCGTVTNQYVQPSNGLVYNLSIQAVNNGIFGDFEWGTTPHIEPAEYFARANEVRAVRSVSNLLPVNTPSCVYGRSSNLRACDQVFSNFVTVTVGGATNWFLMAMDTDNTIPGDSGGPWSFATEADGIHKGDVTLSGGRRNMWSRASLLPAALGVSVITN